MSNEGYLIAADGARLFYNVKGIGSQVVIVPNAIYMEQDVAWLSDTHKVVFYDLRNRGRSATLTDRSQLERGIHHDVDDLETIRRQLRFERVHVLGHSYLGLVVALYAMRFPQHVDRVVQIGPAQADMSKQYPPTLAHDDGVLGEVFTALGQLQAQRQGSDPVSFCKAAWSLLRRMYVTDAVNADKLAHWGFCELENERNMLTHFNVNILPSLKALKISDADYAKVTSPVLTIHGTKDRNAPYGGGRDWATSLPNARLLTVRDAAHAPWVEEPALLVESIHAFLAGNWPTATENLKLR